MKEEQLNVNNGLLCICLPFCACEWNASSKCSAETTKWFPLTLVLPGLCIWPPIFLILYSQVDRHRSTSMSMWVPSSTGWVWNSLCSHRLPSTDQETVFPVPSRVWEEEWGLCVFVLGMCKQNMYYCEYIAPLKKANAIQAHAFSTPCVHSSHASHNTAEVTPLHVFIIPQVLLDEYMKYTQSSVG